MTAGAGATFDLTFFDNSKVIDFDDYKVSFLRKKLIIYIYIYTER